MAYLAIPGEEERFAHPAGGDECTALYLSPSLWRTLAGDDTRPARSTVYVDARLELAHRRVLSAARAGDPAYELAEALLPLVSTTLSQVAAPPPPRPLEGHQVARPPSSKPPARPSPPATPQPTAWCRSPSS